MADGGDDLGGDEEQPGPVEWVDLGDTSRAATAESIEGGQPPLWRPRPVHLLVAAVIAVLLVAVVWRGGDGTTPTASPPTPSRSTPVTTRPPSPTRQLAPSPGPMVRQVGPRLLGVDAVDAGWELFGRGAGVVVRVELAAGRVTTTGVPSLRSSGPVWFVVGADRAFVRPLDEVPGYVVVDGAAAKPLDGHLADVHTILPGPDPEHIWRQVGDGDPVDLALARLDGTIVGQRVSVPFGVSSPLAPDGAGHLAFQGVGGVYDVGSGRVDRVTTGSLLAVGPGRWVAVECDDSYRCSTAVIDLKTGVRRVVGAPLSPNVPVGSVAPDGSVAAIYHQEVSGAVSLHLLDLRTGRVRVARIVLDPAFQENNLVWSPDSRMLFALNVRGQVQVVDPSSGAASPLGLQLPPLSQLAVRP